MLTTQQIEQMQRKATRARNRIGAAMELGGVTQVQLAAAVGLTQAHVSRIRAGHYSDLPGETMRRLANFFGCPIEVLFPPRKATKRAA